MKITMKIYLPLVAIVLFLYSCDPSSSSDDMQEESDPVLSVQITSNTSTPFIDYVMDVEITASNPIKEIEVTDNNNQSYQSQSSNEPEGIGKKVQLYYSYPSLGPRKLEFTVTDIYDQTVYFTETITVTRGNAVRILSAEVISFKDQGKTWDPEYAETDDNRLADVTIGLLKPILNDRFGGTDYTWLRWYISESRMNEANLFFDLSDKELYIDLSKQMRVGLGDDDGGNMGQSLIPDAPDYRVIDFKDYSSTRPSEIILKDEAINLEIKFKVEWPQS